MLHTRCAQMEPMTGKYPLSPPNPHRPLFGHLLEIDMRAVIEKLKSIWRAYLAACREPFDFEDNIW